MVKFIALVIFLFYFQLIYGQYTYFNIVYPALPDYSTAQAKVFEKDDKLISIGGGGIFPFWGLDYRESNLSGQSLLQSTTLVNQFGGSFGSGSESDLIIEHNGHIIANGGITYNCGNLPHPICFDLNYQVVWDTIFTEWNICDTLENTPVSICEYDEESFVLLTDVTYAHGTDDADSSGWRLTRMSYSTGEILEDHTFFYSFVNISMYQIRYVNSYFYILCRYHPGQDGSNFDYQNLMLKLNSVGELVDQIEVGNTDNCWEYGGAMELTPNGDLMWVYSECIEQEYLSSFVFQQHSNIKKAIVDLETFTYSETNFEMPYLDQWLKGAGASKILFDAQGNHLVISGVELFSPHVFHSNIITKFDSNNQVLWQQEYFSPTNGDSAFYPGDVLTDLIQTSDGGYAATGISYSNFTPNHWLLKIDACGYEEPSGCPATIDIPSSKIQEFNVWPNPFYGQLKAVLPINAKRIFITDAIGRVVYQENVYYPNQEWNLGFLEDGVYMMNVESEDSKGAGGRTIGQRVVKR